MGRRSLPTLPQFDCHIEYSACIEAANGNSQWMQLSWDGRVFSDDQARFDAKAKMRTQLMALGLKVNDFDCIRMEFTAMYRGKHVPAYRRHYDKWDESYDRKKLTVPEDFTDAQDLYGRKK